MFLLDTNVISELRKAGDGKADANVITWLASADAATALTHGMTIVSRNVADFRSTGALILNPWEASHEREH